MKGDSLMLSHLHGSVFSYSVPNCFPTHFSQHLLQSCVLAIFPYLAYMMADSLDLSGIVAILFAGIVSPMHCGHWFHEFHVSTCCADHEVLHGVSPFRTCSSNHSELFLHVIKALRNICVRFSPRVGDVLVHVWGSLYSFTCSFVYMGVAVFLEEQTWKEYSFTMWTIVSPCELPFIRL